ncbi:hypothetical protein SAMN04488066_10491 [Halorubrum aquaticum]|uniref:Cox cluster protein n=1 Tax=Halorubrum aquaticum TaxID=387340 RepID=A0A1I3A3V1_9EURY|nr:hypothetical protein [Halorubrum aquaticum]SFH44429.1 hypothetical protein SAMN04488066_10491 [Halorubrum aquaticum]
MNDPDIIDRAAMALSAGLMLLGTVVLGVVEILAGQPYSPVQITNDAGEVVATPLIDPTLRTGLVLAGIAVLGLYAAYRLVTPMPEETAARKEVAAD